MNFLDLETTIKVLPLRGIGVLPSELNKNKNIMRTLDLELIQQGTKSQRLLNLQ